MRLQAITNDYGAVSATPYGILFQNNQNIKAKVVTSQTGMVPHKFAVKIKSANRHGKKK